MKLLFGVWCVVLFGLNRCIAVLTARPETWHTLARFRSVFGFAIVAFAQATRNRRQAHLLSRERIVQMRLLDRVRGVDLLGFDEFTSFLARARRRFARFGSAAPAFRYDRLQARDCVFKFADMVF